MTYQISLFLEKEEREACNSSYLPRFERLLARRTILGNAARQHRHSGVIVHTKEEGDGISLLSGQVGDAMDGRFKLFIGPVHIITPCNMLEFTKDSTAYQMDRQSEMFTTKVPGMGGARIHSCRALRTCKAGTRSCESIVKHS